MDGFAPAWRGAAPGRFLVEVLGPGSGEEAAFTSMVEAYRYASLMFEPGVTLHFRRPADGCELSYQACSGPAALEAWIGKR